MKFCIKTIILFKEHEIVFLWSDKILKINWPIKKGLTISKKDKKGLPLF